MPEFIVLYGGPVDRNGLLTKESAARCDTVLRVAHRTPGHPIIIYSVDRSTPKYRGERDATLAYLRQKGWSMRNVLAPEEAHDTLGETKAALAILRRHDANRVTVISSWYHILRIFFMWWYLGFRGKIKIYASGQVNPVRSLLELGCFLKFFGKILVGAV